LTEGNLAPAGIITKTLNDTEGKLIINRGQIDGLKTGQFVMADFSIIGTISDVASKTARVKLFTDPMSKIKVKTGKLEVYRIMQGSGNISAKIMNFQTTHDVKVGDNVFACKEPGLLDVPMIIGTVVRCQKDDKNPIVWDITVQPACDITQIDEVTVIIMNP
jgi:cell shape-determining protein MreC